MEKKQSHACCGCKEGYVMGEQVYCGIDGRFRPLIDNLYCPSFIQRDVSILNQCETSLHRKEPNT